MKNKPDRKFQELARQVDCVLKENEGLIGDQKAQVEKLMRLEQSFQKKIRSHSKAIVVYQKFIDHIVNFYGNILNAQSYFREKKESLNRGIAPSIKSNDILRLMEFHINFQMISFIRSNWGSKFPKDLEKLYKEIEEARKILIENNLPLAINRAKLFYRKNSSLHHLTILDLINICTIGLIVGIDKYTGEYSKVWASVAIGRMVGFMIEECSQTFLKMYPSDRKILYRANSLKYRLGIDNITELTKAVNLSFEEDKEQGKAIPHLPIDEIHIKTLLNGLSYCSIYSSDEEEDDENNMYDIASNDFDLEEDISNRQIYATVSVTMKDFNTLEKKIFKLKGIEL